jgi:HEAT repeat protein
MSAPYLLAAALPGFRVVGTAVAVVAVLAAIFFVILVVHHSYTSRQRRRRADAIGRVTPLLGKALESRNERALRAAVYRARQQEGDWAVGIVLREARRELRDAPAEQICRILNDMGEVTRFGRDTSSRHEWRRVRALRELALCGGNAARDAMLQAAFEDTSSEVRRTARDGLLADGRPDSIKAAIESYQRDTPAGTAWKRSFYARLAAVGAEELRALLESGTLDHEEKKLALEALGNARVSAALPLARRLLSDPHPEIRATAARVVGKLGDREHLDALRPLLADSEWFVRAAAARAFETVPADERTLGDLEDGLQDQAWWVRANAAHALACQGDAGIESLIEAVENADPFANDAALSALGRVTLQPTARARLTRILSRLPPEHTSRVRELVEATAAAGA